MKEVIPYEETRIYIDDSVYSDSRYVGWMWGRERTRRKPDTVKYRGGSGFSDNLQTIQQLQPQAEVLTEVLTISRNNVSDARSAVEEWVQSLDLSSLH